MFKHVSSVFVYRGPKTEYDSERQFRTRCAKRETNLTLEHLRTGLLVYFKSSNGGEGPLFYQAVDSFTGMLILYLRYRKCTV